MVGGTWDVAAGAVAAAVAIVVVSVAAVAVVQSDRQAIDNKACSIQKKFISQRTSSCSKSLSYFGTSNDRNVPVE